MASRSAVAAFAVIGMMVTTRTQPLNRIEGAVPLKVTQVTLDPSNASVKSVGRFQFAGGVSIEPSAAGVRFGGLSDLTVTRGNRFVGVTDEGQLFEGRLVLDRGNQLTGVTDLKLTILKAQDGRQLTEKVEADAEGLALLPNGDRLVSFERQHRIWRYPSNGGPPQVAPAPPGIAALPPNTGLEGLTAVPGGAGATYLAGSEEGDVWMCTLTDGCRATALRSRIPAGHSLTGLSVSPDGSTLALLTRLFEPTRGVHIVVRLVGRAAIDSADAPQLDELVLDNPLTRDNFEGISLVDGQGRGALRLYLISDNNFSAEQHTYLLAFDWQRR